MDGIIRKDDTPQHKAVREAFTNMIIHADLMLNGLLRVEKYDDRFVLSNPGLLKLPVEQIYAGGESKARNQRMQHMLRMIGYGENLGSGFPLILSAWNEKHWLKPELVEQPELMQVKLILHSGYSKIPLSGCISGGSKMRRGIKGLPGAENHDPAACGKCNPARNPADGSVRKNLDHHSEAGRKTLCYGKR